jgi:hypothetical protein
MARYGQPVDVNPDDPIMAVVDDKRRSATASTTWGPSDGLAQHVGGGAGIFPS